VGTRFVGGERVETRFSDRFVTAPGGRFETRFSDRFVTAPGGRFETRFRDRWSFARQRGTDRV